MSTVTSARMTAEEFFDWCNLPQNRDRHFELERGEVVEVSRPGEQPELICGNIVRILVDFTIRRRKGYLCSSNTDVISGRAPDAVRGPDVILYDDLHRCDDSRVESCIHSPRLAVEVLAPKFVWGRTTRRIARFVNSGIPLVWLVDPEDRSVSVYRPNQLPCVVDEHEELTGEEVLPDLRCRVGDFFYVPGEERPSAEAQGSVCPQP